MSAKSHTSSTMGTINLVPSTMHLLCNTMRLARNTVLSALYAFRVFENPDFHPLAV